MASPETADRRFLEMCSHEEADTAAHSGHKKVMIRNADTDVLVIMVTNIQQIPVDEVWISFGVGKHN